MHKASQYMHSPSKKYWVVVKRILHYLQAIKTHGLLICPSSNFEFHAHSDADLASNVDDRKSTNGYVINMGTILVLWLSKKQNTTAKSPIESECHAISTTTTEVTWIQSLIKDVGILPPQNSNTIL